MVLLRNPQLQGNQKQKIMLKRDASAQRSQADHSRRESLKSNLSQEPRASGKPGALFSSRSDEPGNEFESSVFKYAHPSKNWEDLFLKAKKITCSVRQDLNLWDKSIKLDLSIVVSMSFSNKLTLKDWTYRTLIMDGQGMEESPKACP